MYPASDLDRYLWCPNCRKAVERRGSHWGRRVGAASSLAVGLYIVFVVHPSRTYLVLWALLLALTYVLTGRIAQAVLLGYSRARAEARDTSTSGGSD